MIVPDHLWWPVHRLVISKIASLHEIETHYSLTDVLDVNEALDLQQRADERAMKK